MKNFQLSNSKIKTFFRLGLGSVRWWEPNTCVPSTYDIYIFLKTFQYTIYWEKTQILKKFASDNKCYKKCTLFFCCKLQLITVLLLICDSYMSWNTTLIFLKIVVGFSIFWFLLVFIKVYIFVKQKVWTLWL